MSTLTTSVSDYESQSSLVSKLTKAYYQDDQQVKFMTLQAEIDTLLLQLQNLKSQKLETEHQQQ
ncbi:MAG TPA: hypothetical protein VK184_07725 [Nostocaceae cyanobacterium]|nr:hypothetical protein [Nostocaceae cyanobacterium]